MADVFISYANQDREPARMLANALRGVGWSVWWDRKIIAGQSFDQVIERELDSAKVVVVLWSKHSIESAWVKNEAAVASERGALVPASLEPVKLPLEFRHKQTADLVGWNGDPAHIGFEALCEGISAVLHTKPPHAFVPRSYPRSHPKRRVVWVAIAVLAASLALGIYLIREPLSPISSSTPHFGGTPTAGPPTESYDRRLVGTWKANVVELGIPMEIIWHILPDGTSDYVFTGPAGQERASTTWTYSDGMIFERSREGTPSSASIRWIDENNFVLTIKDNGNESTRGLERHYSRL